VEAVREVTRLKRRLEAENLYLREEIQTEHDFENIVGTSAAMMGVLAQIEIVAATNATVLFTGETGTGKELIARALHERSKRADKPLVTVNCASLPDTLIESELFGHVRGAFSGATNRRVGRFELTDKGTILLDEVGELPLELQAKLLRVLQSGEFEPLGSSQTKKVDVRVIAATNRDLESEVDEGKFRADLYYRLSVFPIEVPPLRDRSEDIPLLVAYFLDQKSRSIGKKVDHISESGMAALVAYDWPGNVRELENFIERAVILCPGSTLRLESATPVGASDNQSAAPIVLLGSVAGDRPDATMRIAEIPPRPTDAGGAGGSPPACPIPMTLEEVERQHILDVLEACEWKVKGSGNAADRLGLNPSTLRSRLKKLGIRRPSR
jgi:transcriptional regulator with GAF, ATPase, and Fis domain